MSVVNMSVGSSEVEAVRKAMAPLEGYEPLDKFVLVYANVNPNGGRLTSETQIQEAMLFAVWLEACASLGLSPSDPTCLVGGQPL